MWGGMTSFDSQFLQRLHNNIDAILEVNLYKF